MKKIIDNPPCKKCIHTKDSGDSLCFICNIRYDMFEPKRKENAHKTVQNPRLNTQ